MAEASVGEEVAGASVGEVVPGNGEGSAGVAVAGTAVEGGGVSCPLLHAAMENSKNKTRVRLIN